VVRGLGPIHATRLSARGVWPPCSDPARCSPGCVRAHAGRPGSVDRGRCSLGLFGPHALARYGGAGCVRSKQVAGTVGRGAALSRLLIDCRDSLTRCVACAGSGWHPGRRQIAEWAAATGAPVIAEGAGGAPWASVGGSLLAGSDRRGVWCVVAGMSSMPSMRRDRGDAAVGSSGQAPAAFMDRPMMGPTQQGQIRQIRGAAVQPADQMMPFTPGQRPGTVREDTAPVPHRQGGPLGRGEHPGRAAQVQRLAGGAPPSFGDRRALAARSHPSSPWSWPGSLAPSRPTVDQQRRGRGRDRRGRPGGAGRGGG
jgi:hypothetical protein